MTKARIMLGGIAACGLVAAFLAFKAPTGAVVYTWNEDLESCVTLSNYTLSASGIATTGAGPSTTDCQRQTFISRLD